MPVPPAADPRPIRVAFCIDNMQRGGTELNAVRTAERLERSRFQVCVVCLQDHGPLLERYADAGIPVHAFPLSSLHGPDAVRQGVRLARFLRRERIEVFHAHDIYSNVFGVPWARVAGVRAIASRRWWEGFPGVHWQVTGRLAYRLADVVLANSPGVARLLERMEGVPGERIAVVPNFLDESAFTTPAPAEAERLRRSLGIAPADRVVGVVASLTPVKDHGTLLRAAAGLLPRWPTLRLVLVGEGECRASLEALARELGIASRTTFAGHRSNSPNLHHLFEVSVLCSTSEGLPNSILEAMAAARPVVATDVGASADAVVHGRTGLLVPPSDPPRLATAIEELLADPERGGRLGSYGQARARALHSPEIALGKLERLYLRLARRVPERPLRHASLPRPALRH